MLGGSDEKDLVDTICTLLEKINLRVGLSDLGVKQEDIPFMVNSCKGGVGLQIHPVMFDEKDLTEIYTKSM